MKIATFGSCLSRYIARAYVKHYKGEIVGSVYHNRIDRFVETYIKGRASEPDAASFEQLRLTEGGAARARVMFANQRREIGLGKHGGTAPGFMEAIKEPLGLVIMDNFVDLTGRLLVPKSGGPGMFMNAMDAENTQDVFELAGFLPVEEAVEHWRTMIDWVRDQQRGTRIFFVNFPFDHHPNPAIAQRARAFAELMASRRVNVVPPMQVHPTLIESTSHFRTPHYAMLAAYIREMGRLKAGVGDVEDGSDDVLWGKPSKAAAPAPALP